MGGRAVQRWAGGIAALLLVCGTVAFLLLARPTSEKPLEETPATTTPPAQLITSGTRREVIGFSVGHLPIEVYTFGAGERELLFVGGIHGGYEWNSTLLAYELIDHLKRDPDVVPETVTVRVIPVLNPDGLYTAIQKEGRFVAEDVVVNTAGGLGRFNAHDVDLNRNFDCKWQAESMWRGKKVSAGTSPFSEPEAAALRDFVEKIQPKAAIFFHSQANAVYASECTGGILPGTRALMNAYAKAAKYPAIDTFDAYPVTGDAEGWLASIDIPAITVELSTHETTEWERNLAGITAVLDLYK